MEKCLNFQLKSLAAIKEKFICKKENQRTNYDL